MLKSAGARCVLRPGAVCALGLLAVVLAAFTAPVPAAAWTDASVRSVHATVTVAPDGGARVAMRVAVRVHGGWLEGLELEGLDPGLVLDPSAPVRVTGEDGAVYVPEVAVRADDGARSGVGEGEETSTRVQLTFARQSAPRRGAYEVALAYTTSLAHRATQASGDGESVRVRWTLPPWQTGLDGVELTLDVPGVARPAADAAAEGDAHAAQLSVARADGRTRITWRRPHLPRTTVWTIAADVPAASLAPALRRVRAAEVTGAERRTPLAPTWPVPLVLALVLLAIGVLTARGRAAALRRAGLAASWWVRAPRLVRVLACIALVVAAPIVAAAHPSLAVVPLVLLLAMLLVGRGVALDTDVCSTTDERFVTVVDLRSATRAVWRARLLTADALLDATTLPGALVLLVLLAAAYRAHALLAATVSAPLVVLGGALLCVPLFAQTHRNRRRAPAEALRELHRIASELRTAADTPAALALRVSARAGALGHTRLEVAPASVPDGLCVLDVVLAERTCGSAVATEPALRVTTRTDSDADRAVATTTCAWSESRTAQDTTRVAPLSALDDVLRALAMASRVASAATDSVDDDLEPSLAALVFQDYHGIVASSERSARSAD